LKKINGIQLLNEAQSDLKSTKNNHLRNFRLNDGFNFSRMNDKALIEENHQIACSTQKITLSSNVNSISHILMIQTFINSFNYRFFKRVSK
jgi:hypothetical protein